MDRSGFSDEQIQDLFMDDMGEAGADEWTERSQEFLFGFRFKEVQGQEDGEHSWRDAYGDDEDEGDEGGMYAGLGPAAYDDDGDDDEGWDDY